MKQRYSIVVVIDTNATKDPATISTQVLQSLNSVIDLATVDSVVVEALVVSSVV